MKFYNNKLKHKWDKDHWELEHEERVKSFLSKFNNKPKKKPKFFNGPILMKPKNPPKNGYYNDPNIPPWDESLGEFRD